MSELLPGAFAELEPLVAKWSKPTEAERRHERMANSDQRELEALYAQVEPHVDAAIAHLNRFDINDLPAPEARLMNLLCSYIEASMAVELFHQPVPPDAYEWHRFECTF